MYAIRQLRRFISQDTTEAHVALKPRVVIPLSAIMLDHETPFGF